MERILWVDLEMTGLDPETAVIIEFAAIITDNRLEALDAYRAVVRQPESELAKMNEWNVKTHGESGLTALVPMGKPLATVENEAVAFVKRWFGEAQPILAGNSIHQDRKFIDKYMASLSAMLHYRMLDVSAFKLVFRHLYGVEFEKANAHRAHDDILASIAELKHYMAFIHVPTQTASPSP